MVIVVVGSCCQVRNKEANGSLLTGGGTASAFFACIASCASSEGLSDAAARPPKDHARKLRRRIDCMIGSINPESELAEGVIFYSLFPPPVASKPPERCRFPTNI